MTIGAVMIAVQLAFRGWALIPSWFYADDYRLLADAGSTRLDLDYLVTPFDSQFMPIGRLLAWLVADSGHVNWTLAATLTLVLQGLASISCLWMLVTVFGRRWGVLALLGIYLTSAMTMSALMWWAASLNQLPLQITFFASLAAWVRYLRSRRLSWLVATFALLGFGLLSYVKTIFVFFLLAYVLLAYFTSGSILTRTRRAIASYWPAALAAGAVAVGFGYYYLTYVPSVLSSSEAPALGLADTMIGRAFTSATLGGPWRWDPWNPPVASADPPDWTVRLAWCALVLFFVYWALRRERTGRSVVLLALYLAGDYVLLLTTRASAAGALGGLEYRYLADATGPLILCLGLVTMSVPGAEGSSRPRSNPLLTRPLARTWLAALVVAICVSGTISSAEYARIWHTQNPGKDYLANVVGTISGQGAVALAHQRVPGDVMHSAQALYNDTEWLVPLAVDNASFPEATSRLFVLDAHGRLRPADIDAGVTSPEGPLEGCGWRVRERGREIPLTARTLDLEFWIKIGYLSTSASGVTVTAGDTVLHTGLRQGLGELFVRVDGTFDSVTLSGLEPGVTLCVDTIDVGTPEPAEDVR